MHWKFAIQLLACGFHSIVLRELLFMCPLNFEGLHEFLNRDLSNNGRRQMGCEIPVMVAKATVPAYRSREVEPGTDDPPGQLCQYSQTRFERKLEAVDRLNVATTTQVFYAQVSMQHVPDTQRRSDSDSVPVGFARAAAMLAEVLERQSADSALTEADRALALKRQHGAAIVMDQPVSCLIQSCCSSSPSRPFCWWRPSSLAPGVRDAQAP